MKVKFPMSSKYGRKSVPNKWSGIGEDIKVEAGDSDGHWLRFTHDGQGQILHFWMGNDFRSLPCVMRDKDRLKLNQTN